MALGQIVILNIGIGPEFYIRCIPIGMYLTRKGVIWLHVAVKFPFKADRNCSWIVPVTEKLNIFLF